MNKKLEHGILNEAATPLGFFGYMDPIKNIFTSKSSVLIQFNSEKEAEDFENNSRHNMERKKNVVSFPISDVVIAGLQYAYVSGKIV